MNLQKIDFLKQTQYQMALYQNEMAKKSQSSSAVKLKSVRKSAGALFSNISGVQN